MLRLICAALFAQVFVLSGSTPLFAASAASCAPALTKGIPERQSSAGGAREVLKRIETLEGPSRDRLVVDSILAGNIPRFLRGLVPVSLSGVARDGRSVAVTICVTPDYLAVGDDSDFIRMPLGLPAAASIASALGFLLPTTAMVDAIFNQAAIRLQPSPMKPTSAMTSTGYFVEHNATVDRQRFAADRRLGALTAGQKKDVVMTRRLMSSRGKVAIYGWHRPNGRPIQPLSTVHGAQYADYSHGIRLVAGTAYVDGVARTLADVLADPDLASIVSGEGPIDNAPALLRALAE